MSHLQSITNWEFENEELQSISDKHLLLTTFNTRNITLHIEDILNDHDIMSYDIICLQETHMQLSKHNNKFHNLNHFSTNHIVV